ncbi:hypothetical protein CsatA_024195 [Cannabis sativa]
MPLVDQPPGFRKWRNSRRFFSSEQEDYGLEEEEEEEEDELIFVLTDEWRDFFAKSEAKRKLEKKQAKKGKK